MVQTVSDYQRIAIARFQDLCSYPNSIAHQHPNPESYMRYVLEGMKEPLTKLKENALLTLSDGFIKTVENGTADKELFVAFYTALDKYVGYNDFLDVKCMEYLIGRGHIDAKPLREKLSRVEPVSLFDEAKKPKQEDRDPTANVIIMLAYDRMNFGELVKEYMVRNDVPMNVVLGKARTDLHEWGSILRIPRDENDTMSPFMVVSLEGVGAATCILLDRLESVRRYLHGEQQ